MEKDEVKYYAEFCPCCGARLCYHPEKPNLMWCNPDTPCGVMELIPEGFERLAPLMLWRPRMVPMSDWICP